MLLLMKRAHTHNIIDYKEKTAFTEFGFALGAGIETPIYSIISLQIDARYVHGTSDILNNPEGDHNIRTNGIQFSAGVLFSL